MANEISISASLTCTKSSVTVASGGQSKSVDLAGDQMLANVQIVGTSAEAIQMADVTVGGYMFIRNMDATNFVQLALDSAVATQIFAKLKPGEFALFRPPTGATIYAKADTANCNCQVVAVED